MIKKILIVLFLSSFLIISAQQNIKINEFLASNINGKVDIETGKFLDWIEISNSSDSLVDLSGYTLSDNIKDSIYWKFPPNTEIDSNSYLLVWADGLGIGVHTNFKLDSDGEQIYLFDKEMRIVDSVIYPKQLTDVSYGRSYENDSVWVFFAEPTPQEPNLSHGIKKGKISDEPEFSIQGGFYNSSVTLELTISNTGTIFYTTDGSIPSATNGQKYNKYISLSSTTVVRAISIEDERLPSNVITHTFFINEQSELPIISLSTDPENFWDDEIGIYTIGSNGAELWGVKANYWQDWERPVHIEFFEEDKSLAFRQDVGVAVNGARRNMLQKSLRIFARKKYGQESINHKIFPEKELRDFSSLVLRNGGYPEFRFTMFRDGLIQNLISEDFDLEYQSYRPSILYVNGKYWGIFNIREKQNEEYLKQNKGVDPSNLEILENNMIVVEGSNLHYKNMINFIERNDLSLPENYDSIKTWMDIDNYINYQIVQLYIANLDWPANNIKYWRQNTNDGKWRWMLFDVDGGFGLNTSYEFNSIKFATEENSNQWNNTPWSTFLFRNLLKNESFSEEFVQRFAAYLSYSFSPTEVINLINIFQNKIEGEFQRHIDRWAPGCNITNPESKDGCLYSDLSTWYSEVNKIREFAVLRPLRLRKHLMNYFLLNDTISLRLNFDNEFGDVYVNGVRARDGISAKMFTNKILNIEARPLPGYRFLDWGNPHLGSNDSIQIIPKNDITISVQFEKIGAKAIPSIITENLELEESSIPYVAKGNIYIYENSKLTLHPGVEIVLPENASIFVFGSLNIKGNSNKKVKIKSISDSTRWGAIIFNQATAKSYISHAIINGSSMGIDEINQIGGISSYNSNIELNFVNMENVLFPIYVEQGSFIMRNSKIHTKVTSDLVNVKYGSAIIENCEFIGDVAVDTDAIDYDDVKTGIIRRNKIYNFNGYNSDAIDIGEGARDVLIEDNLIYNCSDKGISIGQASSAIIRGNIIVNCNLGIGIKDEGSYGLIDHNTFYGNGIHVSCFEKTLGRGGGKADVENSIFSSSSISDVYADSFSEINTKYTLSDKGIIEGEGNLIGEPEFLDPDSLDFSVPRNSITIDRGDPNYNLDPDGSRTNIGASYFDFSNNKQVIITEINYHSSSEHDAKDWIELFNPNSTDINLSNWIFKDSKEDHIFIFPDSTQINKNSYLILSESLEEFISFYPNIENIVGNLDFGLDNSGELIRLFDNYGNIIDSVSFSDSHPWPELADGEGFTLQLNEFELDNSKPENWNASMIYGTPGDRNILVDNSAPHEAIPDKFNLSQNYPNPFNPLTKIKFDVPSLSLISLKIYDIIGREVAILLKEQKKPGTYEVSFNGSNLSSGIYFYQLITDKFQSTKKMVLIK